MTLNELNVGEICKVISIDSSSNLFQRFIDIGIVNGTKIECVLESPFKNPKAYFVRGTTIAIRDEDAIMIEVLRCEKDTSNKEVLKSEEK